MEKRFVIFEIKTGRHGGDIFTDILAPETTEEQAVEKAKADWAHLASLDKRDTIIHVALVEVDEEDIPDPEGKGYNPLWSSEDAKGSKEAQQRALNKYRKEKTKQIILRFYPKDEDIYIYAKELGSTGIKNLIENDMK